MPKCRATEMETHDIHDFVKASQQTIEAEYQRIQRRAVEDPGTAGDQGEENWATLFRSWLPSYFHIVTKGRILTQSGYASPQIDLLVLLPCYPKILLDKKLYLAGGVAAAFECKTTLKAEHITAAVQTAAELRRNLPERIGTPYKELNSTIIYGLLAHSHSWKGENSKPKENAERALWAAHDKLIQHPVECLDFISVADFATWTALKSIANLSAKLLAKPELAKLYGPNGTCNVGYVCHQIKGDRQKAHFSPLGVLLSELFSKLAWTFPDMRSLEEYFRLVNLRGTGEGVSRQWHPGIFSEKIRERVCNGPLSNEFYDEWKALYF